MGTASPHGTQRHRTQLLQLPPTLLRAPESLDVLVTGVLFKLLKLLFYYFVCMYFIPTCRSVCHVHAWCFQSSEQHVRPSGSQALVGCHRFWEPDSLEK